MARFFFLLIFCTFLLCGTIVAAAQEVLTNQSIIKMVKVGLATDLIIGKINEAGSVQFDLSTDGLIALKEANVPDDVIRTMKAKQQTAGQAVEPASPVTAAPAEPAMAPMATSAEQFVDAELLIKAAGQEKPVTIKGVLIFDPIAREVRFSSAGITQLEVPYGSLTGLLYERAAKPRYGWGIIVAWPLLFTKSKSHFFTIQYKTPTGVGDFAIVRLHKKNFRLALATAEAQTGMKVERSEER